MRAVLEARSGLAPEQIDTLCAFGQALIEKNKVMNLTAITEPQAVAELHFLDCIALLQAEDFSGKRVIDVGCGAGFPGVPLKIAEPSIRLTLLDSLAKRMTWLREILPQLGVEAEVVTARAEEFVQTRREQYDIATSRAVARLNILSELCLPYVKVGGAFLATRSARTAAAVPTILLTTAESVLPALTQNRQRSNYGEIYYRNRQNDRPGHCSGSGRTAYGS